MTTNTTIKLGLTLLLALGCEGDPDGPDSLTPDPAGPGTGVEAVQRAVFAGSVSDMTAPVMIKRFQDCRGMVQSAMWSCTTTQAHFFQNATCPVGDSSYVAVGGGGWAVGGDGFPGAFLIDQRVPDTTNRDRYQVTSKSHVQDQLHKLVVYVIGLKLTGVPRAQLLASLGETSQQSSASSAPYASVAVPPGRILLSGYAFVGWIEGFTPGQLLRGSWGSPAGGSWSVLSGDHIQTDPLRISVRLLHIASSVGGIDLSPIEYPSSAVHVNSGLGQATVDFKRGALTSIASWTSQGLQAGAGRFVVRSGPLDPTALKDGRMTVWSKDHINPDGGNTWVNAIGLEQKILDPLVRCLAPPF